MIAKSGWIVGMWTGSIIYIYIYSYHIPNKGPRAGGFAKGGVENIFPFPISNVK